MELRIKRAPRIDIEITVPGDKSISHRAVIIAALSNGVCTLHGFLPSEDCMRTVNAMRALGVKIEQPARSEEHTSELQSPMYLVCRLLLEKKKKKQKNTKIYKERQKDDIKETRTDA